MVNPMLLNRLFGVLNHLSGHLFYAYANLVNRTARWTYEGRHNHDAVNLDQGRVIFTVWHEFYFAFLAYTFFLNGEDIACIALGGPKGRGFRVIAKKFGSTVFMTKKGDKEVNRKAVAGVINEMRQSGRNTFIAVDGPNGPARQAKFGVAKLAKEGEGTILPMKLLVSGKLRIPRWDSQIIPLPFARIRVIYGEPVSGNQDRATIVEKTVQSLDALPDA